MLPSIKVTELNRDRASLLYAIVKGKQINAGLVIYNSIRQAMKGSLMDGLPHPSLIHGLCMDARVVVRPDEECQPPQEPITSDLIKGFMIWYSGISHLKGAGFICYA